MTRVEISICRAAIEKFRPDLPSVKTLWHAKVQTALDEVIKQVLNDETVIAGVYRWLSLPTLLGLIGSGGTTTQKPQSKAQ